MKHNSTISIILLVSVILAACSRSSVPNPPGPTLSNEHILVTTCRNLNRTIDPDKIEDLLIDVESRTHMAHSAGVSITYREGESLPIVYSDDDLLDKTQEDWDLTKFQFLPPETIRTVAEDTIKKFLGSKMDNQWKYAGSYSAGNQKIGVIGVTFRQYSNNYPIFEGNLCNLNLRGDDGRLLTIAYQDSYFAPETRILLSPADATQIVRSLLSEQNPLSVDFRDTGYVLGDPMEERAEQYRVNKESKLLTLTHRISAFLPGSKTEFYLISVTDGKVIGHKSTINK